MKNIDVDELLKDQAKAFKICAEGLKENTLGKYVAAVIEEHGEISVALLKTTLSKSIDCSHSEKEGSNPQLDVNRLIDEAALEYLNNSLLKHHGN